MGSPRILVLDDDRLILQLVKDAFATEGFEVVTAQSSKDAFALAISTPFDLVVSDINIPDLSGFGFRDDLRKLPQYEKVPFVFFSAVDPQFEIKIAKTLGSDRLLIKPSSPAALRRMAYAALGRTRVDRGDLPEALPRILKAIVADRETGVVSAVAGTSVKRVVFHDGKIAFAASNDPREVIGQVFVRAGLISEKDLSEAFAYREANPVEGKTQPLGVVLTALRKVTPEQCEKVFQRKIRETVLDLFLWKTGVLEFVAGALEDSDRPFPIALDTAALVVDGLKRRTRWAEVQKLLPDPSVRFDRKGGSWPAGFPANEGDRVLAKHVESKRSMAEILVELRGQDFAVGARLAELVKNGTLIPVASSGFSGATFHDSVTIDIDEVLTSMEMEESLAAAAVDDASTPDENDTVASSTRILERRDTVPGVPPFAPPAAAPEAAAPFARTEADIAEVSIEPLDIDPIPDDDPPTVRGQSLPDGATIALLTRALVLLRAGDTNAAREGLVAVLAIDPSNPLARQRLDEVDKTLADQSVAAGLGPTEKVKLAIQIHELVGRAIPANDAFLLSRLAAGALSIQELIQICPMPEIEIRRSISGYLASGVLKKAI